MKYIAARIPTKLVIDSDEFVKKGKGKHKIDYFKCLIKDKDYYKIRQRLINGKFR